MMMDLMTFLAFPFSNSFSTDPAITAHTLIASFSGFCLLIQHTHTHTLSLSLSRLSLSFAHSSIKQSRAASSSSSSRAESQYILSSFFFFFFGQFCDVAI
jgi:hypothetical protein